MLLGLIYHSPNFEGCKASVTYVLVLLIVPIQITAVVYFYPLLSLHNFYLHFSIYEGKSIIICNAVVLVLLLAALVVLRIWRMRGFIVIISVQVSCCLVTSIVAGLPLIMAAPLSVCTKEEQCSVIRFQWSEGVSWAAIHQRLSA